MMTSETNSQAQPAEKGFWDDAEIIYAYTRAQAIEDGVLVDVSKTAKEAGFVYPVAMTSAAWADCVAWSDEDTKRQVPQDEFGRLWDVLWMAKIAVKQGNGGTQLLYPLHRVPRGGKAQKPRLIHLKLVCGPGDTPEPVITIMLPDED
jgi:hypothetical protein